MKKTGKMANNTSLHKIVFLFDKIRVEDKVEMYTELLRGAVESIYTDDTGPLRKALNLTSAKIEAYYYASLKVSVLLDGSTSESESQRVAGVKGKIVSERAQALKEIDDFYANLPELLKKYEDKYVAYADGKVHFSGVNQGQVAKEFFKRFGRRPVCVAKVQRKEPTYYLRSPLRPIPES